LSFNSPCSCINFLSPSCVLIMFSFLPFSHSSSYCLSHSCFCSVSHSCSLSLSVSHLYSFIFTIVHYLVLSVFLIHTLFLLLIVILLLVPYLFHLFLSSSFLFLSPLSHPLFHSIYLIITKNQMMTVDTFLPSFYKCLLRPFIVFYNFFFT
jgi:hypothetical protein